MNWFGAADRSNRIVRQDPAHPLPSGKLATVAKPSTNSAAFRSSPPTRQESVISVARKGHLGPAASQRLSTFDASPSSAAIVERARPIVDAIAMSAKNTAYWVAGFLAMGSGTEHHERLDALTVAIAERCQRSLLCVPQISLARKELHFEGWFWDCKTKRRKASGPLSPHDLLRHRHEYQMTLFYLDSREPIVVERAGRMCDAVYLWLPSDDAIADKTPSRMIERWMRSGIHFRGSLCA